MLKKLLLLVNDQTPFSSIEIVLIVPAVFGTVNDDELELVWLEPNCSAQLEPPSVEQVNVCWALTAAGSSRLTRARARRLNFNQANRKGDTERPRNNIKGDLGSQETRGRSGEE
jgi:hypothetical protein